MSEKNTFEVDISSDAQKQPRRIVFITRKTSAKVKEESGPQLMSFPHVILREAIAFQILTIVLVILALFWDAPLEQLANPLLTPNPAKAPWYFLGIAGAAPLLSAPGGRSSASHAGGPGVGGDPIL